MNDTFWEFRQNQRIADAQSTGRRVEEKADDAADHVRRLMGRVDQLALINMALWSLIQERTGLTDEDLQQRMQEIDLADGQADGKVGTPLQTCPHCHKTLSQKHQRCIYCGFEPDQTDPFRRAVR
jgi:hypothetical protein